MDFSGTKFKTLVQKQSNQFYKPQPNTLNQNNSFIQINRIKMENIRKIILVGIFSLLFIFQLKAEWSFSFIAEDGFKYTVIDDTYAICDGPEKKGGFYRDLTIPPYITESGRRYEVKVIGKDAFATCDLIGRLNLPQTLIEIGDNAFYLCDGIIGSLNLPNSIISIGRNAFVGCSGLSGNLVLPQNLKSIGAYAFCDCSGLTGTLELPQTLENIGGAAFEGCWGFRGDLTIPNNVKLINDWSFKNTGFDGKLTISDSVTEIHAEAFSNSNFKEIYIGKGMKKFGEAKGTNDVRIFSLNRNIQSVTCAAEFPPTAWNTDHFDAEIYENAILYYPYDSKTLYEGAYMWEKFKHKQHMFIPATSVSLDPFIELYVDDTISISAKVSPSNAEDEITWEIDGEKDIIKLSNIKDQKVSITGTQVGTTYLTVHAGKLNYTSKVTVKPIPASSVKIIPNETTISVGETLQLNYEIYPPNVTYPYILWHSSNRETVNVDQDGRITGLKEGESIITANCGNVSDTCLVKVIFTQPTSIQIQPEQVELKIGDTQQFIATVEPENASYKTVIWESSNPDVATVDENGLVTAYSSGSAIITAEDALGHTASAQVTVYARAAGISIEPSTPQEIYIGNVLWLKAIVTPEDASDRDVTWESSNPYVAKVDKNGKVIAYKGGKAIITAHCENVKAEIIIRVKIILNKDKAELKVGETFQLNVLSSDTSSESVVWRSSDPEIANVDQNGLITALKEGKTTITASLSDLSAYCEITVYKDDDKEDDNDNDNNNEIVWDQEFRCALGDIVRLQVSNPYGRGITCQESRPDGGYNGIDVYEENGVWYAYCHSEGMVMIEAWQNDFPDKKISKTFIVVRDPEELIYYNGLYFRFIDESKKALKVCRGFAPYEGDYTIPGNVLGYDVLEIEDWAFYTCKNLGKIMIEEGVKKIGDQSFGNGSIYEIHIPSTVTVIKDWAFNANNPGFKDIYLYGLNPVDVNEKIFNGSVDYERCVLHIPYGTIDKYRNATVWSDFLNIVEDIPVIKTEAINIVTDSIDLLEGTEYQLQVTLEPRNTMERAIEWKDYNPEIISVTENGLIRGLKEGKTSLTAVCGDAMTTCEIEVYSYHVETVIVEPTFVELEVGETMQLMVTLYPENRFTPPIEWISTDEEVAVIDDKGLITTKKLGYSTINVISCGVYGFALVDVVEKKADNSDDNEDDGVNIILENKDEFYTVVNLQGIVLMKNVSAEKLNLLEPGSYIIISEISGKRSKVLISN